MKRYFWISVGVLFLSILAGAVYPEWMEKSVTATLNNLESVVREINKDDLNFFFFILLKNLSVSMFVIFVWEIARSGNRLRQLLAGVLPFKPVRKILSISIERFVKIIPVVVLVVNGLIISSAVWYFSTEGIPKNVSALGMLPHGVPELTALCLSCAAGMSDMAGRDRANVFLRLVLPLFVLAAALETWVSPQVMAWAWLKMGQ